MSLDARAKLADRLKEVGEELTKGNYKSYRLARRTLDSLIAIVDDEDIIMTQAVLGVSDDFWENQAKVKGSKEFLEELGGTLIQLATALRDGGPNRVDPLLRRFITQVRRRWLQGLKSAESQ